MAHLVPVRAGVETKFSGPQNLARHGYDETNVRNFLVLHSWIPRNFNYGDGLRILHPLLQFCVGDENMDLALGLVEELIEVEADPPFPPSIYQRWKHDHLHRHDDLAMPHAPHTTTIVATVVPTRALLEWRTAHPKETLLSPRRRTSLGKHPTFSEISHTKAWKIEHTMYVARGGERPDVYYQPTPGELHSKYWDPNHGRGSIKDGGKSLIPMSSNDRLRMRSDIATLSPENENEQGASSTNRSARHSPLTKHEPRDELLMRPTTPADFMNILRSGLRQQLRNRPSLAQLNSRFTAQHRLDPPISPSIPPTDQSNGGVPLPANAVPNATFARKHDIVPADQILPTSYLVGWYSESLDQRNATQLMRQLSAALRSVEAKDYPTERERDLAQDSAWMRAVASYKPPPSPDLFIDNVNDHKTVLGHSGATPSNTPPVPERNPNRPRTTVMPGSALPAHEGTFYREDSEIQLTTTSLEPPTPVLTFDHGHQTRRPIVTGYTSNAQAADQDEDAILPVPMPMPQSVQPAYVPNSLPAKMHRCHEGMVCLAGDHYHETHLAPGPRPGPRTSPSQPSDPRTPKTPGRQFHQMDLESDDETPQGCCSSGDMLGSVKRGLGKLKQSAEKFASREQSATPTRPRLKISEPIAQFSPSLAEMQPYIRYQPDLRLQRLKGIKPLPPMPVMPTTASAPQPWSNAQRYQSPTQRSPEPVPSNDHEEEMADGSPLLMRQRREERRRAVVDMRSPDESWADRTFLDVTDIADEQRGLPTTAVTGVSRRGRMNLEHDLTEMTPVRVPGPLDSDYFSDHPHEHDETDAASDYTDDWRWSMGQGQAVNAMERGNTNELETTVTPNTTVVAASNRVAAPSSRSLLTRSSAGAEGRVSRQTPSQQVSSAQAERDVVSAAQMWRDISAEATTGATASMRPLLRTPAAAQRQQRPDPYGWEQAYSSRNGVARPLLPPQSYQHDAFRAATPHAVRNTGAFDTTAQLVPPVPAYQSEGLASINMGRGSEPGGMHLQPRATVLPPGHRATVQTQFQVRQPSSFQGGQPTGLGIRDLAAFRGSPEVDPPRPSQYRGGNPPPSPSPVRFTQGHQQGTRHDPRTNDRGLRPRASVVLVDRTHDVLGGLRSTPAVSWPQNTAVAPSENRAPATGRRRREDTQVVALSLQYTFRDDSRQNRGRGFGGFDGASDEPDLSEADALQGISSRADRMTPTGYHRSQHRGTASVRRHMDSTGPCTHTVAYHHLPPQTPSVPAPEPLRVKQAAKVTVEPGAYRVNDMLTHEAPREYRTGQSARISTILSHDSPAFTAASYETELADNASDSSEELKLKSPLSQIRARHEVGNALGIMGDFISVGHGGDASADSEKTPQIGEHRSDMNQLYHRVALAPGAFDFEPGTPLFDQAQETTFASVYGDQFSVHKTKQERHPSETVPTKVHRKPTPIYNPPSRSNLHQLNRSDSSPVAKHDHTRARRHSTPHIEQNTFGTAFEHHLGHDNERHISDSSSKQLNYSHKISTPVGHHKLDEAAVQPHGRSTRSRHTGSSITSSRHGQQHSFSDELGELEEQPEMDDYHQEQHQSRRDAPATSAKRGRSPMKKMFGANGWLSNSPVPGTTAFTTPPRSGSPIKRLLRSTEQSSMANPVQHHQRRDGPQSASSTTKNKRSGIMGILKNKIDEISEKADINSPGRNLEKHSPPKLALLSISITPPEQARTMMEVEFMLVHTANKFLMNEFCQGRMSVDSIKKIVDGWKSRGRPVVVEFMYDQSTQRELIVANQHNFRFHGSRAADAVRIDSILYTWKQVASVMAIRTFCSPDTVLLKLLFDIGQILEFLGGVEPIMLRLQQIRTTSTDRMRLARHEKATKEIPRAPRLSKHGSSTSSTMGDKTVSFSSTNPSSSFSAASSRGRSGDEGYVSMLISDSDIERNLL